MKGGEEIEKEWGFIKHHSVKVCVCVELRFSQYYNNNTLFIAFQYNLDLF